MAMSRLKVSVLWIHFMILYNQAFMQTESRMPRLLFNLDVSAPFMLTNRLQREFLRGLIHTEPSLTFRLTERLYSGIFLRYGVWQSFSPYNFKDARREVIMHHAGGGLSLAYLFKTGNNMIDFYTRLAGGYTQVIFTGVAAGVDTAVFPNPKNLITRRTFSLNPSLTMMLYLDDEKRGAVGFNLGTHFMPFRLSRELLYLNKNSDFSQTNDSGPTFFLTFGVSFSLKLGKIKGAAVSP